jgi:hypothetical protein
MLTDPVEIEIISKANQKNVRDPKRSREHFKRIYDDFLSTVDFEDKTFLDLGPGQFDFGVLAQERGAKTVGFDIDPAVLELGKYKGFEVHEMQLRAISMDEHLSRYDGIFCKFSINAFWFADDIDSLKKTIEDLDKLLKADGWAWIAPWNGAPKSKPLSKEEIASILEIQNETFRSLGYEVLDVSDKFSRYYGISGAIENHAIFTKNLASPSKLKSFKK